MLNKIKKKTATSSESVTSSPLSLFDVQISYKKENIISHVEQFFSGSYWGLRRLMIITKIINFTLFIELSY